MRISMWMLANQLYNFEPELHIQNNAPISLKSARRAYATNCVHVFQQGKDVVCSGEGDKIILKDMDVDVAFEIVQSIFDYYDDWKTSVINVAAQSDYEMLLNVSQQIFHNPLLIISPNHKVIAMSNYSISEEQDDEWNYLQKYGFTSYDAAQMFYDNPVSRKQCQSSTPQIMKFPKDAHKSNCLSTSIFYDNFNCGRLTILEVKRKLNVGDIQLTSILTSLIAPYLYHFVANNVIPSIDNPISNLIKGSKVKDAEIERWIKYKRWNRNDTYRVVVLCKDVDGSNTTLPLLNNLVEQNVLGSETYIINNGLVVLVNENQTDFKESLEFIKGIAESNNNNVGISLPFNEISKIGDYYSQAVAAIEYGTAFDGDQMLYDFYDYAVDYLIEQSDIGLQLSAIHPDIRRIWRNPKDTHAHDKLITLSSYIKNERSLVKTSQDLYVHRNTLIYRLKKVISEMEYDVEDSYTRTYFTYSIDVLNLYLRKYGTTTGGIEESSLYYYADDSKHPFSTKESGGGTKS
ncbi:MAG: hypothetical protein E7241_05740 [Lachnospiraceae bacterium]|nr:hypothetical protein [Lachnospiraceae bacterium]